MMFTRKRYLRKLWFLAGVMAAAVIAGAIVTHRQPEALCRNEDLVYFMQAMEQEADADDGGPGEEKVVYLTFDDGPSAKVTPQILDILKQYNVKATFFIIAKNAEQYPDTVKRAADEGHTIASHTYSHDYSYVYGSLENFREEVNKAKDVLTNIVGEDAFTNIFRFPGGGVPGAAGRI